MLVEVTFFKSTYRKKPSDRSVKHPITISLVFIGNLEAGLSELNFVTVTDMIWNGKRAFDTFWPFCFP